MKVQIRNMYFAGVSASVAGLGFNVIADPLVGYFYKQYILGQPQQMAEVFANGVQQPHL